MKLLFVCSNNNWRSRTAETIFSKLLTHQAKSAGIDAKAKVPITADLILWADIVFAMEEIDSKTLIEKFNCIQFANRTVVLDIPDRYNFMDEELILVLKTTVAPYLDAPLGR